MAKTKRQVTKDDIAAYGREVRNNNGPVDESDYGFASKKKRKNTRSNSKAALKQAYGAGSFRYVDEDDYDEYDDEY